MTVTNPQLLQAPPRPEVVERRRIVIVDDDGAQLRALGRVLKRYEDQVDVSLIDNGFDALVAVGVTRPALVVMDVHMPGLDGIEACRRLKANPETRAIQVLLASANMTPELEAMAREAGADRAVAKPFNVAAVLEHVIPATEPAPVVRARGTMPVPIGELVEPEKRRAADVLVDLLIEAGVEVVFGLPGGPISPVHDALIDSRIRVVTTRHESGAMFAAAGYARTTGKLGVAVVTSGPGVLNAMTGLTSAWCDGLPVLLLVGEAPRRLHGKGVLQDGSAYGLNIAAMAAHVTKLAAEVPSVQQVPHYVRRAIATTLSGRRGPALLTLPMDVTTASIVPPRLSGTVALEATVPDATIDEIVHLLAGATRPLILAGSGVRGGGAPAHLLEAACRLQCPVACTPKGKGVFPESHPLALGVLGLGGHPSARAYLDGGIDVLLAIGTSLGDLSTDGFSPQLQASRALIHVDIDARQIGKSYAPTLGVVGNAGTVLGAIAARAPETIELARRTPVGGVIRHRIRAAAAPGRIAPNEALAELRELLPEDAIVTVDSGEHFLWAVHCLPVDAADGFIAMTGLGSMGQSIGAAIGAKLACPDRTVAAIVGDGCFAMNAFEVATAVAERLPLRIFVFNDQRLGMVEIGHQTVYGRKPDYSTAGLDVCQVARGLGAEAIRITGPGQLREAAALLRDHPGPVVVDVRIDPDVRLPKKDRVAAFAPKAGGVVN